MTTSCGRADRDAATARARARATRAARPGDARDRRAGTDYALLDSGHGRKLERYGRYRIVRPEEQAIWTPRRPAAEWDAADATFVGIGDDEADGRWRYRKPLGETWPMRLRRGRLPRPLHLLPPCRRLSRAGRRTGTGSGDRIAAAGRPAKVLNLFGYTGIASLVAAKAGAEVVHIDASKKAIGWARENQAAAGLGDLPIRWICEDAVKFVDREQRRGNRYDGIILDPPKFGRGPKGEVWDIFAALPAIPPRLRVAPRPTSPLFLILTAYSIRSSFLSIHELVGRMPGRTRRRARVGRTGDPRGRRRPRAVDIALLALVARMA